jgi:hypothetical protein
MVRTVRLVPSGLGVFAIPFHFSFALVLYFSRETFVRSPHRVTNNSLRENTIGIASVGVLSFFFRHGGVLAFRECQFVKLMDGLLGPTFGHFGSTVPLIVSKVLGDVRMPTLQSAIQLLPGILAISAMVRLEAADGPDGANADSLAQESKFALIFFRGPLDEVEPALVARGDVQEVEVSALEALRHDTIFVFLFGGASCIAVLFVLFF